MDDREQKTVMRFNLLVRILKGRMGQDFPVLVTMADYGMKPRSDYFAVLLFYLEDWRICCDGKEVVANRY